MRGLELRIRHTDWDLLQETLFPGDRDEHGAALLCGLARSDRSLRLLVRQVIPAIDGSDYLPGVRGYRHLTGEFVTRQLRVAKDLGAVYLAVHNHAGSGSVAFSAPDLDSHERAYPTLLKVSGNPVGALVLSADAVAGDIWMPDGARHPLAFTTVVGDRLEVRSPTGRTLTYGTDSADRENGGYARQALLFGSRGQRLLSGLRVGVVGAGGVGMLIIQALARLGVGEFVVIDPDVVSPSNLPRLPEARLRDAYGFLGDTRVGRWGRRLGLPGPTRKVHLARSVVLGANPHARITLRSADVADDPVARELCSCDFIFLAADTMLARDVVNQIAYQYLVPTLQVGSRVVLDETTGAVRDVYAVIRSMGATKGCLRCNGLINVSKLTEEALGSDEQRRNQRYIDDPEVEAPSVITLNAMGVGWAVNDFMQYATGLGRPASGYRLLRSKPVGSTAGQFTLQYPAHDVDCHVCGLGETSALSQGDAVDLPTRISLTARR
jgi:ThiF family